MIGSRAGTNSQSLYFEDGRQVYPCSCGHTHDDVWDWIRHNCGHDEVWVHDEIEGIGYCTQCGKTIQLVH